MNVNELETSQTNFEQASGIIGQLRTELNTSVMGREDVIDLVIIGLLSGGHLLLEDYPGSGKTTLAKTLGACIDSDTAAEGLKSFRRIQFTPDLLPSDVTGVMVFDPTAGSFHLRRGPVFAHVVLVDEINRTSPKVQSALLESMAEQQVTIDNETYPLDELFLVIATQNPSDSVGTYPLPLAQLDRFLFKIPMTHIDRESELKVIRAYGHQPRKMATRPVTRSALLGVRTFIETEVALHESIEHCLVDIAERSRVHAEIALGLSTRTLVQAIMALKAQALLSGRTFVKPEDLSKLAGPLFRHRLAIKGGAQRADSIVSELISEPLESLIAQQLRG